MNPRIPVMVRKSPKRMSSNGRSRLVKQKDIFVDQLDSNDDVH